VTFLIIGEVSNIPSKKTFNRWESKQDDHGWKSINDFMTMVKERKQYNENMTLIKNGYSEITDCGRFKQTVRAVTQ